MYDAALPHPPSPPTPWYSGQLSCLALLLSPSGLVGPRPPLWWSFWLPPPRLWGAVCSTEVWYGCCRLLVVMSSLHALSPPPLWGGACGRFGWPRPACVGQCVLQRHGWLLLPVEGAGGRGGGGWGVGGPGPESMYASCFGCGTSVESRIPDGAASCYFPSAQPLCLGPQSRRREFAGSSDSKSICSAGSSAYSPTLLSTSKSKPYTSHAPETGCRGMTDYLPDCL